MSAQPTGIRQQQAHNNTTHDYNRHTTGTRKQQPHDNTTPTP